VLKWVFDWLAYEFLDQLHLATFVKSVNINQPLRNIEVVGSGQSRQTSNLSSNIVSRILLISASM
jgi:hypothetical protein